MNGSPPNINAIGAKVTLHLANGQKMMSEQFPSRGFQSSVPYRLHFGLGKQERIDSVEVFWPDRKRSVINNVNINRNLKINYSEIVSESMDPKPTFIKDNYISDNFIDFEHNENYYIDFDSERLLPQMFSNEGPCISNHDLNGDGIQDFFICGAKGQFIKAQRM